MKWLMSLDAVLPGPVAFCNVAESAERLSRSGAKDVHPRKIDDAKGEQLRQFVLKRPDATLAEMIAALKLNVHPGTLCRRLSKMDLPLKKSLSTPASRTGRM